MKKLKQVQKQFILLMGLLGLTLFISACVVPTPIAMTTPAAAATAAPAAETSSTESLFPLTVTDAVGQEFTFDARPRLAARGPVATSLWPTWA